MSNKRSQIAMEKQTNPLCIAILLLAGLLFASCEADDPIIDPTPVDRETLTANSPLTLLIANATAHDGSFDNIIDGASCVSIKFPYVLHIGDEVMELTSGEDIAMVSSVLNSLQLSQDYIELDYPVTVILSNYTELVVENDDQLQLLAEDCIEGGEDADIECTDFVYPITLYTFSTDNQQTGSIDMEHDWQLHRFIDGLDAQDIISIHYPITLESANGTKEHVDSNAELLASLNAAKTSCDEEDNG